MSPPLRSASDSVENHLCHLTICPEQENDYDATATMPTFHALQLSEAKGTDRLIHVSLC